jgi:hypothetical protein
MFPGLFNPGSHFSGILIQSLYLKVKTTNDKVSNMAVMIFTAEETGGVTSRLFNDGVSTGEERPCILKLVM